MDLALPAHVLRDRLRRRELSAAELLEAALARIAAVNPAVNAVVGIDAELARAAAAESDRRLAAGAARPLEGLPITIKDAFDVEGLRSTAGAPAYKDRIPAADAAPVARLRAAGAVIVAKSNVPTFVTDFQAYNPVYGTSNNPWDLGPLARRLVRRRGGRGRDRDGGLRARLRPRRLGALAGPCLRHLRAEDELGARPDLGPCPTAARAAHGAQRRRDGRRTARPLRRRSRSRLAGPRRTARRNGVDTVARTAAHRSEGPARRALGRRRLRGGARRGHGRGAARGGPPRRGGRDHRRAGPAGGALRGGLRGVLAPQPLHRRLRAAAEDPAAPAAGRRLGLAERSLAPGAAGAGRAHDALALPPDDAAQAPHRAAMGAVLREPRRGAVPAGAGRRDPARPCPRRPRPQARHRRRCRALPRSPQVGLARERRRPAGRGRPRDPHRGRAADRRPGHRREGRGPHRDRGRGHARGDGLPLRGAAGIRPPP